MDKLITVITVVYNGLNTIEKTIQSVLEQEYPVEYIIVDGDSSDGTVDIIKQYEKHLTAWVSEKDTGIYDAMNKGTEMASGKWICFLNSGDVFADKYVTQIVAETIKSNNEPDILYGNILVEKSDHTLKERIAKEPCNLHRMYFCHQAAFTEKTLLKTFPFDIKHKMSADLKFFKECYYNGCRFVHLNMPLVIYDTAGISNINREAGLRDNIAIINAVDRGIQKYLFLLRLYFVIYWRKLNGKH
ncbi:MAG: glycosyltransferase [Dysgonamonadaceae bacterium]|jgi:glycosyltransferase involved in cell wall biosynthesis|nr:glycosyltransferase [Dysgonamonadaceae bacterium]